MRFSFNVYHVHLNAVILCISVCTFSISCTLNLSSNTKIDFKKSSKFESNDKSNFFENEKVDSAKGACAFIDLSNPERTICQNCYNVLLASNCPGKEEPSQCLNPLIANQFSILLQQCITQANEASIRCSNFCPSGQLLNPVNCRCLNHFQPAPLSPSDGGIDSSDSGLRNVGPPLVWAAAPFENFQNLQKTQDQCRAHIGPITLNIQNRGNTVIYNNTYEVSSSSCHGVLTKTEIPVLSSSHEAQTHFEILTSSEKEYVDMIYTWTGANEARWTPAISTTLGTLLPSKTQNNTVSRNKFAGPFSVTNSETVPLVLDLGVQETGQYKVSFDLYFFYPFFTTQSSPPETPPVFIELIANENNVFQSFFPINPNKPFDFTPAYTKKPTILLEPYYASFQLSPDVIVNPNKKTRSTFGNPVGRFSTYLITFTFQHQEGPLKLKFKKFSSVPTQTQFGFNYFKVQKAPFKRCAIKYSFIDSNFSKSQYCLKFSIRTDCNPLSAESSFSSKHPPVECTCFVGADPTDPTPYWQLDASNGSNCN